MLKCLFLVGALLLAATGCTLSNDDSPPPKTQLEIRQFQTKNFDADSVQVVMKSMLNVLQDEGYVVKNVALDLGFLSANKDEDVERGSRRFWSQLANGGEARWTKNERIEATINVTQFGPQIRVRTNFQKKIFDNTGAMVSVKQMVDENFYQDFFSKVSKSIFIQEHEL